MNTPTNKPAEVPIPPPDEPYTTGPDDYPEYTRETLIAYGDARAAAALSQRADVPADRAALAEECKRLARGMEMSHDGDESLAWQMLADNVARLATASQQCGEVAGWVLVPIEPDDEMLASGMEAAMCVPATSAVEDCKQAAACWAAMIASCLPHDHPLRAPAQAPKAGEKPANCGNGCDCLAQCGDTAAYAAELATPTAPSEAVSRGMELAADIAESAYHGGTSGASEMEALRTHLAQMAADADRLDWLEKMGNAREGLLLHDGGGFTGRLGLGLRRIGRTLRQAIDAARLQCSEEGRVG